MLLAITATTACNSPTTPIDKPVQTAPANDRQELIPEPDKAERLRQEALAALEKSGCRLKVDTSITGIAIGSAASATAVIGNSNKLDSIEQYHFYSRKDREVLTLTQQPGDGLNQISVFKVQFGDKADYGYRQLPFEIFETGNGIHLGMTKQQIVARMGNCLARTDSSKNYLELHYRISLPKDTETGLLQRHNMPVYYAWYKLWDNRLVEFEFGFEYP